MTVEFLRGGHDAILEFLFGRDAELAQDGVSELGEEALDEFEPGAKLGGEGEFEAALGLLGEPSLGLLGEVGGLIVEASEVAGAELGILWQANGGVTRGARGGSIMKQLAIVTPVFNDWASFYRLIEEFDRYMPDWQANVDVFCIDDGSLGRFEFEVYPSLSMPRQASPN